MTVSRAATQTCLGRRGGKRWTLKGGVKTIKKDHLEPRATRGRGDSLLARHARERGARRSQQYTLHFMFSILSGSVLCPRVFLFVFIFFHQLRCDAIVS